MRVRAMTPADAGAVARLSGQLGYPATTGEIEERVRALQDAPDSAIFVAVAEEGAPVGWAHVVGRHLIESDPFAELMGLVVDAAARRRGAGRALVTAAERWAGGRGYRALHVRSNMLRVEARPFYERMGYAIVKTQYVFRKSLG